MIFSKNIAIVGFLMLTISLTSSFCPFVHTFDLIQSEIDAVSKEVGVIYLVGEQHMDEDDIKQKNLLIELAKEGKIICAEEGSAEDFSETLFGLEELHMMHIAGSLLLWRELFLHMVHKKTVDIFGSSSIEEEYGIEVDDYSWWNNHPSHSISMYLNLITDYLSYVIYEKPDPEECAFILSQQECNKVLDVFWRSGFGQDLNLIDYIGKNSCDDNFYDNISHEYKNWYILLIRIPNYWYKKLIPSSIFPTSLLSEIEIAIIEMNDLFSAIENMKTKSDFECIINKMREISDSVIDDILLNVRNEIFMTKICAAYEKTRNLGKPFFVVVGAKHVPFLKEELLKKGYRVQINDRAIQFLFKSNS